MPIVLGETPPVAPAVPPRKRWTRQEIEVFERSGAWEGQHFELIEGDLINKMGKYLRHALAVKNVAQALALLFGWKALVWETSMDVSPEDHPTSNPEPDVLVLKRDPSEIRGNQPAPADVALVVEVSDSTLAFDLGTKAGLYARAGIAEYWVLDINGRQLIVHREPAAVYKSVVAYAADESVAPLAALDRVIAVAELLG